MPRDLRVIGGLELVGWRTKQPWSVSSVRRHIHYESAFEDYLRSRGLPYVAVDEQRKAIFSGGRVKSFDFLVYMGEGDNWLADIKGRQFPYHHRGQKRYWENWVTREDLEGLQRWQKAFGPGFTSVLIFAYLVRGPLERTPTSMIHPFQNHWYAFMCVSVDEYCRSSRQRSPLWDTVSMPVGRFREVARPIQQV